MKRMFVVLGMAGLVLLGASSALAAKIGDPAAPLHIAKWVKGGPVDLEAVRGKKVVVVEFWATWCGPCLSSIPHLTEMAKKYAKDAIFIGVTDEKPEVVEPFLEKMGNKMDYVVAIDKDKQTSAGYMRAYNQGGIPHAFIVDRDGKLAWHAHPMTDEFEEALKAIIAGTFDQDAAIGQQEAAARTEKLYSEYFMLASKEAEHEMFAGMEQELVAAMDKSAGQLNAFAWTIATRELAYRNLDLALETAKRACTLSANKDASILDTYARVLWELGRKDEAVAQQKKAVAAATSDREREVFQKALDKYLGK